MTDQNVRPLHLGLVEQLVELVHDLLGRDSGGLRRTNVAVPDAGPVVGAGACFSGQDWLDPLPDDVAVVEARIEHDRRGSRAFALDVEAPATHVYFLAGAEVRRVVRPAAAHEPGYEGKRDEQHTPHDGTLRTARLPSARYPLRNWSFL
jgi:hypothetical protein